MKKPLTRSLISVLCALASCADVQNPGAETTFTHTTVAQRIFGGVDADATDPVSSSSVALLEGDGEQICSGTLVAPDLVMAAAHCFTTFRPYYVSFGPQVAQKQFWTDDLNDRRKFPYFREIVRYTVHPDYDPSVTRENAEAVRPPNDIAVATIAEPAPAGFHPARVIAPSSALARDITLAGFGAFPEYNPLDPAPPRLRKAHTFIGALLPQSKLFRDGPNPGIGSCVRDSGGSVYLRTTTMDTPIVIGNVVSGPWDCHEGRGYNSDLRFYVPWIESITGTTLARSAITPPAPSPASGEDP